MANSPKTPEAEDDGQEEEQAYAQDPPPEPKDIDQLEIDVKEDPFPVSAIVQTMDKGQLIATPGFQRATVWTSSQQSEFIESILLNYPLPPLFLNQDRKGRYIVVDGLQRVTSISRYLKNDYPLDRLTKLPWLNGLRFHDLSGTLQSRIEDRKLLCYVLKPTAPMSTVYDIFARINRGGTPLNQQEIRHALYQGPATVLLAELAADDSFAEWLGFRLNPQRMGDREAVLRSIAFSRVDPETMYREDMDAFLGAAMAELNSLSPGDQNALRRQFTFIFTWSRETLGEDAFRLPSGRARGPINRAVIESVYRFLAHKAPDFLYGNRAKIAENYTTLVRDAEYVDAVRLATGSRRRVQTRFRRAAEILGAGCAE